jgi:hypothetical protein
MRATLVFLIGASAFIASLPTGLGSTMEFPHPVLTADSLMDAFAPADANEMLKDLKEKVEIFISERDGNDTSAAESELNKLAARSTQTMTLHAGIAVPDKAWDDCLIAENASLHAWKVCQDKRATQISERNKECAEMKAEGVGYFTIDGWKQHPELSYKLADKTTPYATCNFEDFTIDGYPDLSCDDFVEDIIAQAKTEFNNDWTRWTTEKSECHAARKNVEDTTADCGNKEDAYFEQEKVCVTKHTTLLNRICTFQQKLEVKCTTLGLLDTLLTELKTVEEDRNKEFRTVMRLRCLFTRYTTTDDKCFDKAADTTCDRAVDGASTEYGSKAAQELHVFRTQRDGNNTAGGFSCAVNTITFGDNVRYVKSDPNVDYSYYKSVAAQTYTTSAAGILTPAVCGVE